MYDGNLNDLDALPRGTAMAASVCRTQRLRFLFLTTIILLAALTLAVPALADYLGPDRTVTETERVRDPKNDVWTLIHVDPNDGYRDTCLIIHRCDEPPSVERQQALCGWIADSSGCEKAYRWKKKKVELPEATIAGDLNNCAPVEGWCSRTASLQLTAQEPLAGETILAVEGTRNGEVFACEGSSCSVSLFEGANSFTYWALSSFGDSSRMGERSARMDSRAPELSGEVSGTAGEAGWWVSPAVISAQASDPAPGSGLAAIEVFTDGSWAPYEGALTVGEGLHELRLRARDLVGHTTEADLSVRVDTRPPNLDTQVSGEEGEEGWWITPATVSVQASDPDPGSGLAVVEASVDGAEWIPAEEGLSLGEGVHDVFIRARDHAGHEVHERLAVQVDGQPPRMGFASPAEGGRIWVARKVLLQGFVQDATSDLRQATLSLGDETESIDLTPGGDGAWSYRWDTTAVSDGAYDLLLQAVDRAGNRQQARLTALVDNTPPRARLPDSWPIWQELTLRAADDGAGLRRIELTLHGGEMGDRRYRWRPAELPVVFRWDRLIDGQVAPVGKYWVTLEVLDQVWNRRVARGRLVIPAPEPRESPTLPVLAPVSVPTQGNPPFIPPTSEVAAAAPTRLLRSQVTATPPQLALRFEGDNPEVVEPASTTSDSSTLWGPAAVALAGAATAYALSRRRQRKAAEAERLRRAAWENSPAYREERLGRLRREGEARAAVLRAQMVSAPETAQEVLEVQRREEVGESQTSSEPASDLGQLKRMEAITRERDYVSPEPYVPPSPEPPPDLAGLERMRARTGDYERPSDAEQLARMERRAQADFTAAPKVVQMDEDLRTTYQVGALYTSGGLGPSLPLPTPLSEKSSSRRRSSDTPSPPSPVPPWNALVNNPPAIEYGSVDDLSPVPEEYREREDEYVEIDESTIRDLGKLLKVGRTVYKVDQARAIEYVLLDSGKVGVRVNDLVPPGSKLAHRLDLDIPGTRYNPSTLTGLTASNLMKSSVGSGALGAAYLTSLGSNVYDYGIGDQSDIGIWSNEFAASTMVDLLSSVTTGVISAGVVSVALIGASTVGFIAISSLPLWAPIAIAGAVGFFVGPIVNYCVETFDIKNKVTEGLSSLGGALENLKIIIEHKFSG